MNKSELIEKLQSCDELVFCSHDAGGAELLSSFIIANNLSGKYLLSGPAIKIFNSKDLLSSDNQVATLQTKTSILLSSTGTTDFEYSHMFKGIELSTKVIALIDHWVNYKERFERQGKNISPNTILVVDQYAFDKAKREFPKIEIILIDNDFLERLKKEYYETELDEVEYDYVFMCESRNANSSIEQNPVIDHSEGLKYFFEMLSSIGENNSRILIRPHPADLGNDYKVYVPINFPLVKVSSEYNLIKTLRRADIVVGCNSMALVIAESVGKRVYSAIKKPSSTLLPIAGIKPLSELKTYE